MYWREVVASLYSWDLLDEGLDAILDTLEQETRTKRCIRPSDPTSG